MPAIESAVLGVNISAAATDRAVSQLPGEVDVIVQKYSNLLCNEHHDLCKLLSSGSVTTLRAHAAVRSLLVLSHTYMCPYKTAERACESKQPFVTANLGLCA